MAYKRPIKPFTPEQLAARRAAMPAVTYPAELPVSARREDIMRAIKYSQVVIVAGETGSGKTTQLPKMCLELGLGVEGLIGHTQPRRIAARSVAERISAELGVELGGAIGYQVRFTDRVSENTLVKLMTDGILLAEIQSDPELRRYSAIIIDEAHERSLNIDFLLGYLARLLPRRPDLKLIITSATIDSERFAAHFGEHMYGGFPGNKAPIIEVSGRTYPVEIRYRPLWDGDMGGTRGDGAGRSSRDTGNARGDGGGRFARDLGGDGGVLNVSGEETSLRPTAQDQTSGIIDAAEELMAEGDGDILVFLSGEGEIHETQKALKDELGRRYIEPGGRSSVPRAVEVLPLYARLSAAEQHRIFEPHQHRRIILATNIAETSLTVPGIRYVIDPGTARISRYSNKTKVQRLPIEAISQASANQRAGRCGRVQDGIAIRLYSEEDFAARPEYTEPEIQRTSLAAVILQMASLGLGSVDNFPFIDPPDMRAVRAGVQLLQEIGALTLDNKHAMPALTRIGRQLARLPIDPRLGRMLLAAADNGCAAEVLVLVAAMSVQDVRERPAEYKAQADQLHARFTEPSSDFLAYLNLWRYLRTQQRELSGSAFRRLCRDEHINWLRWREWQDVAAQLRELAKPLKLHLRPITIPDSAQISQAENALLDKGADISQHRAVVAAVKAVGKSSDAPAANAIHRSLMVGLLSNLGSWDERKRDYEGARGTHFVIWPGSGLNRKRYSWVMAAELVETTRLFARSVARVQPEWIEPIAQHLVKRTYSEPFWSTKNGAAMVHEKVTLYGLTVTADRPVLLSSLGTADARELARELFIRSALVEGQWRGGHHAFVAHNAAEIEKAREVETRLRTYGLIADEDKQYAFFDERLPENIVSARHFEKWWKGERQRQPDLLNFTQDFLLGATRAAGSDFPSEWHQGEICLPITYEFHPGTHADGLSIDIPVTLLPQLRDEGFDWLVPGMLPELVTATIRALPKRVRRNLVPVPDTARAMLEIIRHPFSAESADIAEPEPTSLTETTSVTEASSVTTANTATEPRSPVTTPTSVTNNASFQATFTAAAAKLRGVVIDEQAWQEAQAALPSHLKVRFIVRSERGAVLDEGTSLSALQRSLAPQSRSAVQAVMVGAVAQALDEAQRRIVADEKAQAGAKAAKPAIPQALTEQYQRDVRRGFIRKLAEDIALPEARITTRWNSRESLALASSPYPSTADLVADLQLAATRNIAERWVRENKNTGTRSDARSSTSTGTSTRSDTSSGTRSLTDLSSEEYGQLRAYARERLESEVYRIAQITARILEAWGEAESALRTHKQISLIATVESVRAGIDGLVYAGFISRTPEEYLADIVRYMKAATHRLSKAETDPDGDDDLAWIVRDAEKMLAEAQADAAGVAYDPQRAAVLIKARWMIEELRVSLFAQQLGTRGKVSIQRIRKLLNAA